MGARAREMKGHTVTATRPLATRPAAAPRTENRVASCISTAERSQRTEHPAAARPRFSGAQLGQSTATVGESRNHLALDLA